MDNQINI